MSQWKHTARVIACRDLGAQEVRAATHWDPGGDPAALPYEVASIATQEE